MIEIGTKVKIKRNEADTFLMSFSDSWFEDIREVSQITDDGNPARYYVSGLYWLEDDLVIFTKEEYPEYYI
jgi:hypothetical protein